MADAGDQPTEQPRSLKTIFVNMVEQKIELLLWLSRMSCLSFTVLFILGGLGGSPHSFFQKALISNGVTSALRLHQRIPRVRLNMDFFRTTLMEDSCHYLIYSVIFAFCSPMSIALLPPALFALLHSTSFSIQLLENAGMRDGRISSILRSLHQNHRVKVFQMIAMAEIMLMPMVLIGLFTGRCNLSTPYFYYRFLEKRYSSQRNPYTRHMFYELRIQAELLSRHPSCPLIVNSFIHRSIRFISARAPEQQQQHAQ